MATHKTITRNEVNAIKSGVFSTDLKKSVLYSEVSGNSSFNVSATNNASGLNYKANQILLESDIMAADTPYINLTVTFPTVLASATTNSFIIVTSGIDNSTLGYNAAGSSWITTCTVDRDNFVGHVTFPQNTFSNSNFPEISVSGRSSSDGTIVYGSARFEQKGITPTPTETCKFKFVYNPEVVVTNVTGGQIIFDGTSQEGTESFKLILPGAVVGTGFNGTISPYEHSYVSITSKSGAEQEYSRTDVIQIPIEYNFVGTKDGMYNQKVELSVAFSCEAGFDNFILNDGGSATLDVSSWFSSGNVVTVNVTFEINVGNQTPN